MSVLRTVGTGVKLAGVSLYLATFGVIFGAFFLGLLWRLLYQLGVLDSPL